VSFVDYRPVGDIGGEKSGPPSTMREAEAAEEHKRRLLEMYQPHMRIQVPRSDLEVRVERLEHIMSALDSWSRSIDLRLCNLEALKCKETVEKLTVELEIVKGLNGL